MYLQSICFLGVPELVNSLFLVLPLPLPLPRPRWAALGSTFGLALGVAFGAFALGIAFQSGGASEVVLSEVASGVDVVLAPSSGMRY